MSEYLTEIRELEARSGKRFVEALCCECGSHFTKWRSPRYTERAVYSRHRVSEFERATFFASCAHCATFTKHARLRHDDGRDLDEQEQAIASGGPVPASMIDDDFPGGSRTAEGIRENVIRFRRAHEISELESIWTAS